MHCLKRLMLTLPVLALPLAAVAVKPAEAALSAEQGLTILARAKAADTKCNFLSGAERRELTGYLARAEMASRGLMDDDTANTAIANGRASGKAAKCSAANRSDVEETLLAARLAVAEADGVKPEKAEKPRKPSKTGAVSLAEYRELTKPYFVDLRCKQLSGRKPHRYYDAIKDLQAASIAKHGTAAVANAQARARKDARGVTCGPASQKMAEAGLAAILRK
jgi:hypothetical protein